MPPTGFYVDFDHVELFKGQKVFCHAWLAGTHSIHDVSARCRAVR